MEDGKEDLTEIDRETAEQITEANDMALEIEDHRARARELEEAVGQLREAREGLRSEGLDDALKNAAMAKEVTEERLEGLRERRDEMLRRNEEMAERCHESVARKKRVLEKMPRLVRGVRSERAEARAADPFYQLAQGHLASDLDRTQEAEMDLRSIHQMLEDLDV